MVASVHSNRGRRASTLTSVSTSSTVDDPAGHISRAPARSERTATRDASTGDTPRLRRPRLSLYARVVAVNAAVLAIAAALLASTPVTISFPVAFDEGLILAAGVAVMVVANALLLRGSFRALTGLVQRMETLDLLRPRQRLPLRGGRETRTLIETFNTMLERLEIERRTSTRRTLSALEGERRRIGQELHDEIGQRLTGILLQLGRAAAEAPEPLRERLDGVQAQARAALDEVGALAWQLRPGILDDLGLLSALRALAQTFQGHAEARINVTLPAHVDPIAPEVELAIYRIAQEGLNNALRHAGAQTIELELRLHDDGLVLVVTDDGRGITGDEGEGPGIRGMRERALLIDADLRIDSPYGQGTRVRLDVPRGRLLA
jgi:two-component system, NarL family, sensor histidine kinase UhpB